MVALTCLRLIAHSRCPAISKKLAGAADTHLCSTIPRSRVERVILRSLRQRLRHRSGRFLVDDPRGVVTTGNGTLTREETDLPSLACDRNSATGGTGNPVSGVVSFARETTEWRRRRCRAHDRHSRTSPQSSRLGWRGA
ncbi:hypothetical protein VNO77_27203 [Canavalia gladiata]|uniref:Uncharacterized protein n=1 Tax=Canavalia gladiata TaxID=3824 RepID=A0AAN9KWS8_CANGL